MAPEKKDTDMAPEKKDTLVKVRVLRDYWLAPNDDGSENRVRAGTEIEIPVEAALDGVEAGMLERVK